MKLNWIRLPGVFKRYEVGLAIRPAKSDERGEDWFFESAGTDGDGVDVFAVYYRPHNTEDCSHE